jgi:hypothetical protein
MEYIGAQAKKNTFRIQTRGNKVNLKRYLKKNREVYLQVFLGFRSLRYNICVSIFN